MLSDRHANLYSEVTCKTRRTLVAHSQLCDGPRRSRPDGLTCRVVVGSGDGRGEVLRSVCEASGDCVDEGTQHVVCGVQAVDLAADR